MSYQQSAKKSEQNLSSWPVWSVECNQQILKKVLKQRPVIFFIFTNTYASTILNAYYELRELNIIHSKITHDQHVIIRTKKSSLQYTVHYTFKYKNSNGEDLLCLCMHIIIKQLTYSKTSTRNSVQSSGHSHMMWW